MAAGNEAQRSDRIERGLIWSLHFVTLPAAISVKDILSVRSRERMRLIFVKPLSNIGPLVNLQ